MTWSVCVRVSKCFSFNVIVVILHESLFLLFKCAWAHTYCNGVEEGGGICHWACACGLCTEVCLCVCAFLCVRAIQISFWSLRKPEINRSQSVFRRLDRQFCFKTSKHHLYSTFKAHKCVSDIYERQREREREREEERGERAQKREGGGGAEGNRSEEVYFWHR